MATNEKEVKGMACREPFWEEMTVDQKIERLKSVTERFMKVTAEMAKVVERLSAHTHAEGKVLINIIAGRDEQYFGVINRNPFNSKEK